MHDFKTSLLDKLRLLEGLEARPSPVAGGTALFYRDKEFAHFHHSNEIDLRLTKARIRELGLTHPANSATHPDRSANSPYIELRFNSDAEVDQVVRLVKIAIDLA